MKADVIQNDGPAYPDIMAARSWRKKMSETMPGTILYLVMSVHSFHTRGRLFTSPAAAAKPEKHLAANSPV